MLFDDALQLDISTLKRLGYILLNKSVSGNLAWRIDGEKIGEVSIRVNILSGNSHVQLDYYSGKKPRSYKIELTTVKSNLGKGVIWHFICPKTHKRCRKLYCIDGLFLHREAFSGCMYDSQIQSKEYRELNKTWGEHLRVDKLYEQIYQKHFKKTYAGIPTKRYLKLMSKIEMNETFDYSTIKHF